MCQDREHGYHMDYRIDHTGEWKTAYFKAHNITEAFAKLDGYLALHYPKGWVEMGSHRAPYDVEAAARHGAIIPEIYLTFENFEPLFP